MKISASVKKEYILSPAAIDLVASDIIDTCTSMGVERRSMTGLRLSAEESLGVWLESFGEGAAVTFELTTKLLRPYINISVEGERLNPYDSKDEDFRNKNEMLMTIGLLPIYFYAAGRNVLSFPIKKKPINQFLKLGLIIAAALCIGICGKLFIPAAVLESISSGLVSLIEDTIFKILSCIAGPMIFLSVAWGIFGIGDVYTLGRIGKKMMLSYIAVVFAFVLAGSVIYPLLGQAFSGGSGQSFQIYSVLEMLMNIIPGNIFSPFIEGNTLQIILLATIVGVSLIYLGKKTTSVARAVEQVNHIVTFLMGFISKIVPYFVIIVVVQIIWAEKLRAFSAAWRFVLVFLGAYLLALTVFLLIVAKRTKTGPLFLLKTCLPSYIIALTTASSAATFDSNMSICRSKLGIDPSVSSFGIPLGMVVFKPTSALFYLLLCFYYSSVYGVSVSLGWLITAVFISAVMAISTPPIPGGAAVSYSLLFLQLGIPVEAVAVSLAMDMIFDFILTSGDMMSLLLELFNISNRLGVTSSVSSRKK